MANNNREIEVKFPLSKKEHQRIKDYLDKKLKLIKISHHSDSYFTPINNSFLSKKYPYEWLTVRNRDGKTILNYKHWYPENVKYTTHCDEYQTEVVSRDQLIKILTALGFGIFIEIIKERHIYNYKNDLEIALDEVADLGYFIEIEAIRDFGTIEKARKRILEYARNLGITRTRTVPGGYAAAMMRRKR